VTDQIFEFEKAVTPGEQRMFRAFECFVTAGLGYFCWTWAIEVGRLGEGAFHDWAPKYAGSLLEASSLAFINAGLITLLLGLGWFRQWDRYMYLAALPLVRIQYVGRYWPEDGLHHSHWLGMCLLAIGLSFFFFRSHSLRLRFALGASYVFVAAGYSLSALSKLRQGGLGWIDPGNFQMMISANQVHRIAREKDFAFNALQQLVMSYDFVATLILVPALLIELSAVVLCFRRFRMYSATAILLMHLGVIAAMEIYFPVNIGLMILLGYPWATLIESTQFHPIPSAHP
jgi:hypothetical protein